MVPWRMWNYSPEQAGWFCLIYRRVCKTRIATKLLKNSPLFKVDAHESRHAFKRPTSWGNFIYFQKMMNEINSNLTSGSVMFKKLFASDCDMKAVHHPTVWKHSNASVRTAVCLFELLERQFPIDGFHFQLKPQNCKWLCLAACRYMWTIVSAL